VDPVDRAKAFEHIARIEALLDYDVDDLREWDEAERCALALTRLLPNGMEGDLAVKVRYAAGYAKGAGPLSFSRERGRLIDYLWRLRATLKSAGGSGT